MRRRVRLTPVGWYYLVLSSFILGGAILQQFNLLVLLFVMLMVPLVWNWFVARKYVKHIVPMPLLPEVLEAFRPYPFDAMLENRRRWGRCWSVMVHLTMLREGDKWRRRISGWTLQLPPRQKVRVRCGTLALARGRYRWEGAELECSFPLGLAQARRQWQWNRSWVVFPALGELTRAWHARGDKSEQATTTLRRRGLLGGEFYDLRDYRPGDNPRWIHWRTSARRDGLVVRQFEDQTQQGLCLVLDLWFAHQDRTARHGAEVLISFAATVLADQVRRARVPVWLILLGDQVQQVRGPCSQATLHQALEALALAHPSQHDHLKLVLEQLAQDFPRGTELVVVSPVGKQQRLSPALGTSSLVHQSTWVSWEELNRYFQPPAALASAVAEQLPVLSAH